MARTRRELLKLSGGVMFAAAVAGCTDGGEEGEADEDEPEDEGEDDHDHDEEDDHDHDEEEDHDDDDHGHVEVEELEIVDGDGEEVAYIHDDHWHGELQVPIDETVEYGAVFVDEEGEEIPLGEDEEYELNAEVAEGAQEGIVEIEPHGNHVDVTGEEEGLTEVVFQLWHDDHADYESPPIDAEVAEEFDDEDDDHGHDHDEDDDHGHDDNHDHEHDDDDHGHDEDDHGHDDDHEHDDDH